MIKEKHTELDSFEERYKGNRGVFQKIPQEEGDGPAKSIEGWILFIRGIHEEADEEDVMEKFSEFGPLKHLHLNLDRKTGYLKGYALIEYEDFEQAKEAIARLDGSDFLGQKLSIDFAFKKE